MAGMWYPAIRDGCHRRKYVDLQSVCVTPEAQETQMLELMKKAQTIEEILTVQSRLAEIQSQIEQIKGRMKYMESRTDFATITVDLRETKEGASETERWHQLGFHRLAKIRRLAQWRRNRNK